MHSDARREGAGSTHAYIPALDGVRAIAVVAVLLFHAGVPGATGGYLGVSLFFTLSGFLMGSLLLRERH
ncbi:MAG TPA: acyltransferase family protein, partial [Acidimicrobiia bacterium]|nr:acyltransferase family protein [Acidimicrobiia bacterium]